MRRFQPIRAVVLTASVFAAGGCGGASPVVAPPAPTASASAVATVPPPPDLSPVPTPPGVFARARWKNPGATLGLAHKLVSPPMTLEKLLDEAIGDSEVRAAIELNAPIDAAFVLDPNKPEDDPTLVAMVSLPLKDMRDAERIAVESGASELVEISPSLKRIHRKKGEADSVICDLAQSVGTVSARLICGTSVDALDTYASWFARTVPTIPDVASDLHAEVDLTFVRGRLQRQKQGFLLDLVQRSGGGSSSLLGPSLNDGSKAFEDLAQATIDFSFEPSGARLAQSVHFASAESRVTKLLLDAPVQTTPIAARLVAMPADADALTFSTGRNGPLLHDVLRDLLRGASAKLGEFPSKEAAAAWEAAVASLPDVSRWVSAHGLLVQATHVDGQNTTLPQALAEAKERAETAVGWHVIALERPASEVASTVTRILTALDAEHGRSKQTNPRVHWSNGLFGFPNQTKDLQITYDLEWDDVPYYVRDGLDPTLRPVHAVGKPVPRPTTGKPPKTEWTTHVTVTPNGEGACIVGVAGVTNVLLSHVLAVRDGTHGMNAQKSAAITKQVTDESAGVILFPGPLAEGALRNFGPTRGFASRDFALIWQMLHGLPHRGEAPIFLLEGANAAEKSVTLELVLNESTLGDLAGVARFVFALLSLERLRKPSRRPISCRRHDDGDDQRFNACTPADRRDARRRPPHSPRWSALRAHAEGCADRSRYACSPDVRRLARER